MLAILTRASLGCFYTEASIHNVFPMGLCNVISRCAITSTVYIKHCAKYMHHMLARRKLESYLRYCYCGGLSVSKRKVNGVIKHLKEQLNIRNDYL